MAKRSFDIPSPSAKNQKRYNSETSDDSQLRRATSGPLTERSEGGGPGAAVRVATEPRPVIIASADNTIPGGLRVQPAPLLLVTVLRHSISSWKLSRGVRMPADPVRF